MDSKNLFPPISDELIKALEAVYPPVKWEAGVSIDQIANDQGRRDVIEFLKRIKYKQEKNILNP